MADFKSIRIEILSTKGSTPRAQGAKMWVSTESVQGSIGGGYLEASAVARARAMIADGEQHANETVILGTEIGQCCGGVVELEFASDQPILSVKRNLAIFGAGHVGSILARLARDVGYNVALYDSRTVVEIENPEPYTYSADPPREIHHLEPNSDIIILTHDHGLDFRIAEAALLRDDLAFIGMIGSESKAAQFRSQFRALGARLDRLHSPIAKSTQDKRPAAIALAILSALYSADAD